MVNTYFSAMASFFRVNSYGGIQKVLLLFYALSVMLGLNIQIYDAKKKMIYTSRVLVFYSIVISMFPMFHYKTSETLFQMNGKSSMVSTAVNTIEAAFLIDVLLLGLIRRYMNRRSTEELFDKFVSIHNVIGYKSAEIYNSANKKVINMLLVTLSLLIIPIVLILKEQLQNDANPLDVLGIFTTMYPKLMIVRICAMYCLEMRYIHRYLELGNLMLSELHQKVARELQIISFGKCSQKHSIKLHRIMMIRSRIIDLAFNLNKAHNEQMLSVFTLISVLAVSQLYFLFLSFYRVTQNPNNQTPTKDMMTFFCFILVMYIAFSIAESCEITVEESRKTSEILHGYNSLHMDAQLKQTVEMFLIQLMHHPIKFSACGMFTLDYSVLFSIITSATSYLIILIQFEMANNCGSNKN